MLIFISTVATSKRRGAGMLDIRISLDGDEQTPDAAALYQWLYEDLDGRRPARLALRQTPPKPGHMGAEQFVQILLDHPELIEVVTSSLIRWYATLRRRPTLRLERAGDIYVIENLTEAELRRILGTGKEGSDQQEKDGPNDDR
ncbi:UNVERIFIED_ORG: hypothetical protein CLV66_13031 [Actinomadura viridilutea]